MRNNYNAVFGFDKNIKDLYERRGNAIRVKFKRFVAKQVLISSIFSEASRNNYNIFSGYDKTYQDLHGHRGNAIRAELKKYGSMADALSFELKSVLILVGEPITVRFLVMIKTHQRFALSFWKRNKGYIQNTCNRVDASIF